MLRYANVQKRKRNANPVSNESLKPFLANIARMSWVIFEEHLLSLVHNEGIYRFKWTQMFQCLIVKTRERNRILIHVRFRFAWNEA